MAPRTRRAARALAHLPEADPSLAALALWCETTDGAKPHTYTSQDTIHIGTQFPDLPLREQIGVLGHHVLHVALRHEARAISMQVRLGNAFDMGLFNLCADAMINSCLIAAEHAIPRPAVTLPDVVKLSAQDTDPRQMDLSTWDVETLYVAVAQNLPDGTNSAENYMREKQFNRDLVAKSAPQDADRKAAEWHAHLKRAMHSAGAAGRGIGRVLARLASALPSNTPWEVHMRGLLARALLPDPRRSFKRPRATWIAAEAYARQTNQPQPGFEPGFQRSHYRPRIAIGLDTSGSIGRQTLELFAGEILGIANRTNAEIHLLCFDELVYDTRQVALRNVRKTLEQIDLRREGGTSFSDVFSKTDALKASVLVVLTDLAAPLPIKPKTPVIWAAHALPDTLPAFGRLVDIRG